MNERDSVSSEIEDDVKAIRELAAKLPTTKDEPGAQCSALMVAAIQVCRENGESPEDTIAAFEEMTWALFAVEAFEEASAAADAAEDKPS